MLELWLFQTFAHPTAQVLEQHVGICHAGHFYLTKLLMLPALEAGTTAKVPSHIICLTSLGHRRHQVSKLLRIRRLEMVPYDEWTTYGNVKLCNLLQEAQKLHERFFKTSIFVPSLSCLAGIHTGLQTHVELWIRIKWAS
jgi:hypothetical protein